MSQNPWGIISKYYFGVEYQQIWCFLSIVRRFSEFQAMFHDFWDRCISSDDTNDPRRSRMRAYSKALKSLFRGRGNLLLWQGFFASQGLLLGLTTPDSVCWSGSWVVMECTNDFLWNSFFVLLSSNIGFYCYNLHVSKQNFVSQHTFDERRTKNQF